MEVRNLQTESSRVLHLGMCIYRRYSNGGEAVSKVKPTGIADEEDMEV